MNAAANLPNDYNGLCPICQREPELRNIGRDHFMTCPDHPVYWYIGSNLFSGWRYEPESEWAENRALLATFREVNPHYHPVPDPPQNVIAFPVRGVTL